MATMSAACPIETPPADSVTRVKSKDDKKYSIAARSLDNRRIGHARTSSLQLFRRREIRVICSAAPDHHGAGHSGVPVVSSVEGIPDANNRPDL
jgi:hypothetical protein